VRRGWEVCRKTERNVEPQKRTGNNLGQSTASQETIRILYQCQNYLLEFGEAPDAIIETASEL
jgi:hypothetical protein